MPLGARRIPWVTREVARDMSLSPRLVDRLARHGFEAVHWSTIGAATAPDVEILAWAHQHSLVLVTNDLDFSAILAAGAVEGPSVVHIRTQALLSRIPSSASLPRHSKRTARTSSEARSYRSTRLGSASECCLSAGRPICRSTHRPDVTRPLSPSLVARVWIREGGTGWGNRNSGAPFPLPDTQFVREAHGVLALV